MKQELAVPGAPFKQEDIENLELTTQEAVRERMLDVFSAGVLPSSQLGIEPVPFYITPGSNGGLTINVGSGIAVGPNNVVPMTEIDGSDNYGTGSANTGGERCFISVADTVNTPANYYSNINGTPTSSTGAYKQSSNGLGGYTATPQSTGTVNIPLVNGVLNYVWLSYLQTINLTVTSLHTVTGAILFPSALDGYEIVVNQSPTAPLGDPRWIQIGTVNLTTSPAAPTQAMITTGTYSATALTLPNRVAFAYNPSLYAPVSAPVSGTTIPLETFLNAKGTGTVTAHNIFGLSLTDIGYTEDVNLIQHEHYHHSSGLVVPSTTSTTSALYPQIQAGGPVIGITYSVGMKQLSSAGAFPEQLVVGGLVANAGVGSPPIAPASGIPVAPAISVGDPYVGFSASTPTGLYYVYIYLNGTQPTAAASTTFSISPDTYLVCSVSWNGSVLSGLTDMRLFGTIGANNIQQNAVGPTQLAPTAVTPGTYGNATQTSQVTIDQDGRITTAANVSITGVPAATVPAAGILPGNIVAGVILPVAGVGNGTLNSGVVAVSANGLNSASTTVSTTAAVAPATGQVLTATSGTAATWQYPVTQVPVGTVLMFAGSFGTLPSGFLVCDGSLQSQSLYPLLYAALDNGALWGSSGSSFYLPDLRGMFVRGANDMGTGAAVAPWYDPDSGSRSSNGNSASSGVGSYQADGLGTHTHTVSGATSTSPAYASGGSDNPATTATQTTSGPSPVANETRAKNAYVLYMIKHD